MDTAFASRGYSPEAERHGARSCWAGTCSRSHQGSQWDVFRFSCLSPTRFPFYFEQSLQSAGGTPAEAARSAPTPTNLAQGMAASSSSSPRRIMNIKRKLEDKPAGLPPRPQTGPPTTNGAASPPGSTSRTSQQRASTSQTRPLGISIAGAATRNGQSASVQEDEPRAAKRAKKGGGLDESPSLLSRMTAQRAVSNGSHLTGEDKRRGGAALNTPPRQRQQDIDRDPVVGFSIKGAAKASGSANGQSSPSPRTTLLARIQGDEQVSGGQRKKRRTKAS